jgi:hypothetical protein
MTALPELQRLLVEAAEQRWNAADNAARTRVRSPVALRCSNAHGRGRYRIVLLAVAVALAGGTGVAVAAGLISFGDPVPVHTLLDVDASTLRIVAPLVDDPAGGPPWTVRAFDVGAGTCLQIGRVQDGVFGLVGSDGRFHRLAPGAGARGCGGELARSGDLMSTVVSAGGPDELRSIVYGVLGREARSLTYMPAAGAARDLKLTPSGAYLLVVEGKAPARGELIVTYNNGDTRRAPTDLSGLSTLSRPHR